MNTLKVDTCIYTDQCYFEESQQSQKHTIRAHQFMIVATMLIATSFPVVSSIAGTMDSVQLVFYRFLISTVLFLPYILCRYPNELLKSWRLLPQYSILGVLLVLFFTSMFEALRTTTPAKTAAIFTLGPILSSGIGFVIVGESMTKKNATALLCGMLGAMWVVFSVDRSQLDGFNLVIGDFLFLFGTVCFALYTVLVKRFFQREQMAVMTFWTLATGTVWLLMFCGPRLTFANGFELNLYIIIAIGYLAVFTTLITFFLTQKSITVLGPTKTVAYTFLNPALVLLFSCLLGDTNNAWIAIPGVGLTLISIVILQLENVEGKNESR